MTISSGSVDPFTKEFDKNFGSGTATVLPPVSKGVLYTLCTDLGKAIALISPLRPVKSNLTEAVRLINAVHTTLGKYL